MASIFMKSLRRVARDEWYDIFNDQDRFFAIMADYVGESDPDSLNCLLYAASKDILLSLGDAYRNPRNIPSVLEVCFGLY